MAGIETEGQMLGRIVTAGVKQQCMFGLEIRS
jgi:hypothetical protein